MTGFDLRRREPTGSWCVSSARMKQTYCCWPCSARLRYLLYFFSSPSVKTAGRESSLAAMYGLVRGLLSASASRSCRGHRDRKLGKPLVYRHRSFCSGEKMPCSELEFDCHGRLQAPIQSCGGLHIGGRGEQLMLVSTCASREGTWAGTCANDPGS